MPPLRVPPYPWRLAPSHPHLVPSYPVVVFLWAEPLFCAKRVVPCSLQRGIVGIHGRFIVLDLGFPKDHALGSAYKKNTTGWLRTGVGETGALSARGYPGGIGEGDHGGFSSEAGGWTSYCRGSRGTLGSGTLGSGTLGMSLGELGGVVWIWGGTLWSLGTLGVPWDLGGAVARCWISPK